MTPQRIQRKRTKGWRAPAKTLNITRPSRHGNPYPVPVHGLKVSLKLFENYLTTLQKVQPTRYQELLDEVRAADFVMCYCPVGSPCHGDIWIRRANEVTA